MKKQLLILGNGFDLSCGLKSSYNDFFEYRLTKVITTKLDYFHNIAVTEDTNMSLEMDTAGLIFIKHINETHDLLKTLSFWEIFFYYSSLSETDWNNIEKQIQNILFSNKRDDYYLRPIALSTSLYNALHNRGNRDCDSNYYFLFNELKKLEHSFCAYIDKQVQENDMYYSKAEKTLGDLFDKIDETLILNFNYTIPFNGINTYRQNNIHGLCKEKNIIFGIDSVINGSAVEPNDSRYTFTKTYRKLTNSPNKEKSYKLPSPQETCRISFFGHSLSSADYSYFQTLFDYYHIYDSNVELYFYYKVYDNNDSQHHKIETVKKATELLNSYSKTLDNKNHGNNLIHKLTLEQRIFVVDIDEPSII